MTVYLGWVVGLAMSSGGLVAAGVQEVADSTCLTLPRGQLPLHSGAVYCLGAAGMVGLVAVVEVDLGVVAEQPGLAVSF